MSSHEQTGRVLSRRAALAFAALMSLGLSGCLQPLYGTLGGGGDVASRLQTIKILPIGDRLGHYLENELIFGLNGTGAPIDPKYELKISVHEGVYAGVTGPTFETRAEYKLLHIAGGDAVGMSTVQEVIAARHLGLSVFAVSVITDLGIREEDNIITHEEVLQAAAAAEPKLTALFRGIIDSL